MDFDLATFAAVASAAATAEAVETMLEMEREGMLRWTNFPHGPALTASKNLYSVNSTYQLCCWTYCPRNSSYAVDEITQTTLWPGEPSLPFLWSDCQIRRHHRSIITFKINSLGLERQILNDIPELIETELVLLQQNYLFQRR
jgi:hypothetical protein